MLVRLLVVALPLLGCAAPDTPSLPPAMRRDASLQFEMDDLLQAATQDMAMGPQDLAGVAPRDLGGPHDLAMPKSKDMATVPPSGCTPVVNEVLLSANKGSSTQASYEFVELYNPCSASVNLNKWSLRYRSESNNSSASTNDTTLVSAINKTITAGGYLLYVGSQYTGSNDGKLSGGLSDNGGGVALVDNNDNIVDSVAYGPVVKTHNFLEGSAAPLPKVVAEPGQSIARTPNGTDTNDNSADFKTATPTPKAAN
jgi:Lamin Tail Domain